MQIFSTRRFPACLFAGVMIVLLGGCMKQSTLPGGIPGGPPGSPPGSPSGSPSGTSTSPVPGTHTPGSQSPGSQAGRGDSRSTDQGSADKSGAEGGKSPSGTETGRSDDEILAEALDEFGKRNTQGSTNADGTKEKAEGEQADAEGTADKAEETASTARQPAGPATNAEQARDLNRELDEEFAKFDKVMQRERDAVAMKDNEEGNRGFSDRAGYDTGGEGDEASAEEGEPAANGDAQADARNNDADAAEGPGLGKDLGAIGDRPPIPADLASAEGDDIIARQLREAAMKEPDPELREKLWDEYRKYKRGQ